MTLNSKANTKQVILKILLYIVVSFYAFLCRNAW